MAKTEKEEKAKESTSTDKAADEKKEKPKDAFTLALEEVREHCRLIERTVVSKESRFVVRVLRALFSLRKKLTAQLVRRCINGYYTHSATERDELLAFIPDINEAPLGDLKPSAGGEEAMETDQQATTAVPAVEVKTGRFRGAKSALTPLLPEVDAYLHLLVLLYLLDRNMGTEAVKSADELMKKLATQNRRTLDHLAAKCYYYYTMAYEKTGRVSEIRGILHSRLRTATLRNDFEGQAVLINCLLRSYVYESLYDQADKLVNKTNFPDSASNNEWARYLYYLGRIKAIQLDYSESHKFLVQSLRKAPQYSASGFRHTVLKLSITVELLLGNIPERKTFLSPENKRALTPYFQLTQAVRSGDVLKFADVLKRYDGQFKTDSTFTLILRLHHNVIKTAIRTISLAYSKIQFKDVAKKLALESAEDAEFVIAKAIRDHVIEAVLDHENKCMQSKETMDIYSTREPQHAFHERIEFCLDLHNSSVKAMRFPPKSYHEDLESAEDRREREAQDLELAKEMAEEDDDMM